MHPTQPSQRTVMVVDDSEVVLTVARTLLEGAGYRVITHNRPTGCVAMILQEKPALVLVDVNMPELGGDSVVKLFGRVQYDAGITVLLHSSLPADVLGKKAAASGAHGYIRKTDDSFEFLRQVNRWLSRTGTSSSELAPVSSGRYAAAPLSWREGPVSSSSFAAADLSGMGDSLRARSTSGTRRVDPPSVLFVDDDMLALSSYRRAVQAEELSVDFALSGAQALARIRSLSPPNLVVSDVLMPSPSGEEIYDRACALDRAWRDRFIFVTGARDVDSVSSFLASFRGPVLYKPVDPEELRRTVRRTLGLLLGDFRVNVSRKA